MDVLKNRTIDDVIILGSGLSISKLTNNEINYINKCKTVIALNKFMIFYKKSKIIPTHVFFLDNHANNQWIIRYLLTICRKDKLKKLTFILNKSLKDKIFQNNIARVIKWLRINKNVVVSFLKSLNLKTFLKDISKKHYLFLGPKKSAFIYTTYNFWLEGGEWATNINQSLFHFRGSLTSVLNYVSITNPNQDIYLVGNDFNSGKYFFQKELDELDLKMSDWTTEITKKKDKHFSVIDYNGTTIYDKLPFILEQLHKNGNHIYNNNPNSLLVTKGKIKHKKLPA